MNRTSWICSLPGLAAHTPRKTLLILLPLLVAAAGCTGIPVQQPRTSGTSEPMTSAEALHATQVFIYPNAGQDAQRVDRDRYECYVWAVGQTGFDPSQPSLAPHQRVEVVAIPPPEGEIVASAVTGAAIGAVVSRPRHAAEGALVGAILGGIIGGATQATRTEALQNSRDALERQRLAQLERQSNDYRRALTACLEGRGYTVK